jgi:hypothetical protein
MTTICVEDQQGIGAAAGFSGSLRSVISTISTTVYDAVLNARLGKKKQFQPLSFQPSPKQVSPKHQLLLI